MRAPLPRRLVTGLIAGVACLSLAAPTAASGPSVTVVLSGLDNPRGVAVSSGGRVLVAETGSGKVLQIRGHRVNALVSGLPYATSPEGDTTGVVNVAVRDGREYLAMGGGPQNVDPRFDSVLRVRSHTAIKIADVQAYRNTHPDTTDIDDPANPTDSNAYGIVAISRHRELVTDAAGNELDLVDSHGRISTVAKFPNALVSTSHLPAGMLPPGVDQLPAEAVPTTVAVGPDGYWYVGELKGFPFTPGASRIWRISPSARNVVCDPAARTGPCTVFADGLTSVTGMDFGPDGALYVVEMVKGGVGHLFFQSGPVTGALIRLKDGERTEIAAGEITLGADVAVARDGTIYVTDHSIVPGEGRLLAIR